jgi:hypothetical protein
MAPEGNLWECDLCGPLGHIEGDPEVVGPEHLSRVHGITYLRLNDKRGQ